MVVSIIQIIAVFLVPALIMRFRRNKLFSLFGTIGMAYFFGLLTALAIFLLNLGGIKFSLNSDVGEIGSYAAIGVAIPLLLFAGDLRAVKKLTKTVLLSFGALIVSVAVVAVVASHIFGRSFEWGRELCAMSSGLYTGGTPNFNAIGVILGTDADVIALGNLSDMIIGGIFYVFILLAAKPLLSRIMDRRAKSAEYMKEDTATVNVDDLKRFHWSWALVRNIALSLGCVAVGAGVGALIWSISGGKLTDYLVPAIMIAVTVLGLALSFVKRVRDVDANSTVGHYLILVFSFALASSLDLGKLTPAFLKIFLLLTAITVVSFVLHVIISRLLRIDSGCTIVTMTAGIYGPAFVPAITRQLKRDELTAPGLICGALGYAVGTFLGSVLYLVM